MSSEVLAEVGQASHPSAFRYPLVYELADLHRDMGPGAVLDDEDFSLHFTPLEAIDHWWKLPLGQYQRTQTARFSAYHQNADIAGKLGIADDSDEAFDRRLQLLHFIAEASGANIHPIGHAAVYFAGMCHALYDSPFQEQPEISTSILDLLVAKQTPIHHDTPETCHPEIVRRFGRAIGDIPTGSKTPDDRKLEYSINKYLLSKYFPEYTTVVRHRMENQICHRTRPMSPTQRAFHDLGQAVHDLTHRDSASDVYDHIADAPAWMHPFLEQMVRDVDYHTTPKLQVVSEKLPHMADYIADRALRLAGQYAVLF